VYKEHLEGRPTLVFCVDVAHAESLARAFRAARVAADCVTGTTPSDERARTLRRFADGTTKVLTNCMVLTEGYDETSIAGIILARPTKSSLLYTQMIGRGTRLHPGKENVLIVDIVDVTRDQRLATLPSLFGLAADFNLEGRTTAEVQEALEWVEQNRPWVQIDQAMSLSELRYRCKKVNLFDLSTPQEVCAISRFAWAAAGRNAYRLGLAGGESITVAKTILGTWEVLLRARGSEKTVAGAESTFQAFAEAERFVEELRGDSVGLVLRTAKWRAEPATAKQIEILERRGLGLPAGLTKGHASHLIGMLPRPARA
jgi:hypothetical protein